MHTIQTLIDTLECAAPLALQAPWDNSGLQVGCRSGACTGLVVALDPTQAVVDCAVAQGATLIVTHHPLLFKGVTSIDTETSQGRLIDTLIRHGITLYALHTPVDAAVGGLNDRMIEALGVEQDVVPLEPSPIDPRCGLGRIGRLAQPMTIRAFVAQTAQAFSLSTGVAYTTPSDHKPMERVAVCSGSGASMIDAAADARADVLVCGDVKHHDFGHALERNLALIDATHYATEIGFVDWVEAVLADIRKKNTTFAIHSYRNNFISYYTR